MHHLCFSDQHGNSHGKHWQASKQRRKEWKLPNWPVKKNVRCFNMFSVCCDTYLETITGKTYHHNPDNLRWNHLEFHCWRAFAPATRGVASAGQTHPDVLKCISKAWRTLVNLWLRIPWRLIDQYIRSYNLNTSVFMKIHCEKQIIVQLYPMLREGIGNVLVMFLFDGVTFGSSRQLTRLACSLLSETLGQLASARLSENYSGFKRMVIIIHVLLFCQLVGGLFINV